MNKLLTLAATQLNPAEPDETDQATRFKLTTGEKMNYKSEPRKANFTLQLAMLALGGKWLRSTLFFAIFFAMCVGAASAQCVSLTTPGSASTQNFNTLSNTAGSTTNNLTITGWFMTESGSGARDNEQYAVDTGGSNTGDTYSYGAAGNTERALGGLQSGTLISTIGACFTNNTGVTITSLNIAYIGEQWRIGNTAAARDDRLDFQYSLNATSLTTGTWLNVNALDFTNPIKTAGTAGALDGNAAANRTAISSSIAALSIANGATFWIRWEDLNASGADDGLAVDDFSLTPQTGAVTPTLNISDVTMAEGDSPNTTTFTFAVTLTSSAGPGGVTFEVATADNTATTGNNDYQALLPTGHMISEGSMGPLNISVTVNGDNTPEPNETFFVNITNIVGANAGDIQGQGTIQNDDVALTPIHDIQGPGASSPIVGSSVTTRGIVTGVKSNGFFIQEPDATVDADPATSEGVFVFTSSAPPAAAVVGALVQVTATVVEFVPPQDPLQPPLTELSSPTVLQLSTGNPLPAAISLTTTFPDPAGPHDQLERLEGMRVGAASLTVVAPTDGNVNETSATSTSTGVFYGVLTGVARPFREAGIQAPDPAPSGGGTIPPIPRFDSNPERIRVDSDGLVGGPLIDVSTSAVVTGLIGPLDYTFRTYTILPDPGATIGVTGGKTATLAATSAADEFTIATYNLERFFDTVNDPGIGEPVLTAAAFDMRLNKASLGIRNNLKMPDIVGLVEVENLTTLQALAARISADAIAASQPDPQYDAFLVEGNDVGGIDVGYLVKTAVVTGATPRVEVVEVQQELDGTLLVNPDSSTEVLNDRPPLRLNAIIHHANGASFPVTVILNHLRSLNDANSESAGTNGWPTIGARVRAKRQQQAEDLANLVQARQVANPGEHIVLIGDFNAFEVNDGLVHSMAVIAGTPVPDNETAVPGDGIDLVNPDLDNLFDTPSLAERYSFLFDGNAQNLDHMLVNAPLITDTLARRIEHPRINADFPETARNDGTTPVRLSDHDPLVGYFKIAAFQTADLALTKIDGVDPVTAGTNLAYTITVTNSGPDAAANTSWSDTLPAGTTFVSLSSPGGWSCTTPAVGSGGMVSCSIASQGVGSAAFTLTVAVAPSVAAGTVLSNTASVTSTTGDLDTNDLSATETTTVTAAADLSVTKADNQDPVTAGNNLTYTITVTNSGPSNAATVSLSDTLPAGTTFVSLSSPGGWSCSTPAVGSGGTVSCSIPSLAAGNAVFTLVVQVGASVANGTVLSNTATVTSTTPDPNPGLESATATTTVTGIVCPTSFTVNNLGDASDANTGDGVCATAGNVCTLRAALEQANALPNCAPLTINFSVNGTINLATALPLLEHPNLTIQGPGANLLDVQRNSASQFGVFYNISPMMTINDLTISNGNPGVEGSGGGVFNDGGTLTLNRCHITDNTVGYIGGGVGNYDGMLTINDSTISNNRAETGGAGVSNTASSNNATITLTNSTISGNQVTDAFTSTAGGVLNLAFEGTAVLNLLNCTITNNSVSSGSTLINNRLIAGINGGGGLHAGGIASVLNDMGSANINLKNTLLAGNNGVQALVMGGGTLTSQGNNLDGDGTTGFTNGVNGDIVGTMGTPINPLLAALGNYGGTTPTHALLPGSPALNKGNNTGTPAADQRGTTRPQQLIVDIGAFESCGFTLAIAGGNNQTTLPNTLFPLPLLVSVTPNCSGEPVNGGLITYTPPGSGASATLATSPATISGGQASVNATANGMSGAYQVSATTSGANTVNFNLTNGCVPLVINPPNLPNAQFGVFYSQTLVASNAIAPYTFSLAMGSTLPAGLTLSMSGLLSGTPTAPGTVTFTVNLSDINGCTGSRTYTLTVACPAITINPAAAPNSVGGLPNGVQGMPYNQTLVASPAGGNYTYAVTTNILPPGLTLNHATGAITGTPSAPGNFTFVVTATGWASAQGSCTKSQSFNLLITGTCAPITLTPATLPGSTIGLTYTQTITAAGGVAPYSFSVSNGTLPPGLGLDATTGVINGTLTTGGTFIFTIKATGQGGCFGTRTYVVQVGCTALTFNPATLPNGTVGQNYNQPLTITPAGTYTFSLQTGSLPPGFTLSSAGVLSGITSQTGTFTFTVKALGGTCQGTKSYTLVIGTNAAALAQLADYDGDGRSDFALWSNNGMWRLALSNGGSNGRANRPTQTLSWGQSDDISLLGDYDGDGQTDLAVFRPAHGTWYVKRSSDGNSLVKAWGTVGDVPVPGDYDGDGQTDIAVFRPSNGNWYVLRSSDQQSAVTTWGAGYAPFSDVAVPGDYDGDGRTDIAVFRRGTGTWLVRLSSTGQFTIKAWGLGTDVPVAADYDGDGRTDFAVWRGTSWYIWQSTTNHARLTEWGSAQAPYFDQAAPGDYDGDGKADIAVWRAAEQTWYVLCSQGGSVLKQAQGQVGDRTLSHVGR